MRFPEFGITDDRRAVIVQDEVRTTSFRELLLAAPEDGVRKHPVEDYPQWPLLGPVRPMQLEARVENHGTVKKINVEERDPAFQTVRHGHPIEPAGGSCCEDPEEGAPSPPEGRSRRSSY